MKSEKKTKIHSTLKLNNNFNEFSFDFDWLKAACFSFALISFILYYINALLYVKALRFLWCDGNNYIEQEWIQRLLHASKSIQSTQCCTLHAQYRGNLFENKILRGNRHERVSAFPKKNLRRKSRQYCSQPSKLNEPFAILVSDESYRFAFPN